MIKFPKVHIATSVVNRLLNAADHIEAQAQAVGSAPSVPDAGPLGEALNTSIAAPAGPMTETDPQLTVDLVEGALFP